MSLWAVCLARLAAAGAPPPNAAPVAAPGAPRAIPLVGGTPIATGEGPTVGVVAGDGRVVCTGALVAPDWVLTAAHCLVADPPPAEVWWGADLRDGPDAAIAVDLAGSRADPAWSGAGDPVHDVALLKLAAPAAGPTARLAADPPDPGEVLDVQGYGDTLDGAGDAGRLQRAALEVLDVDEALVRTYSAGRNLCSGDSGAPLAWPGATPLLAVAVGAFVDPTCLGGAGGAVRVDAVRPFLDEVVPDLVWAEIPREPAVDTDGAAGGEPSPPPPPRAVSSEASRRDDARGCRTGPADGAGWGAAALVACALGARRRGHRAPRDRRAATGMPHDTGDRGGCSSQNPRQG